MPDDVIASRQRKPAHPYADDPLGYYRQHYPGLTRGQLQMRNKCLYHLLWRKGLLREVPMARR